MSRIKSRLKKLEEGHNMTENRSVLWIMLASYANDKLSPEDSLRKALTTSIVPGEIYRVIVIPVEVYGDKKNYFSSPEVKAWLEDNWDRIIPGARDLIKEEAQQKERW